MKLEIYGSSDDLVCIANEEFSWEPGDRWRLYFNEVAVLEITPVYNGYWAFAVATLRGEDYNEWPFAIGQTRTWGYPVPYSETVTLACVLELTVQKVK